MAEAIRRRRRVKIVATIGPASSTPERLEELFRTGADVFRVNFSHGTQDGHAEVIDNIRRVEKKVGRPIGILADLQGPKLRVGRFASGHVVLQWGRTLRLDLKATPGDGQRVQLPHPEIMAAAGPGSVLLLDDGRIRLEVTRQTAESLDTRVIVGGRLSDLGLARHLSPGSTLTGMGRASSVEFTDPDLLSGARPSRRTEVWALGATIHRALVGSGLYGELPDTQPLLAIRRVLSTRPQVHPGLAPAAVRVGGFLRFDYRRPVAVNDLVYQVQWSDTLTDGAWSSAGVGEEILSQSSGIRTVRASVPVAPTGPRRFARLNVVVSP